MRLASGGSAECTNTKRRRARVRNTASRWGSLGEAPRRRRARRDRSPSEQNDEIALVALEGVDGADPQVHRHQVVGGERGQHRRLDGVGLGPERRDHADAALPRRASSALSSVDDPVDLGPHHAVGVAPALHPDHVDAVPATAVRASAGRHRNSPS